MNTASSPRLPDRAAPLTIDGLFGQQVARRHELAL